MTIEQLVTMAEHIHDVEGVKLGSSSTREQRNAFWARVIGCAYWGHPIYNSKPDTQWNLKKNGPTAQQTDDVATSLPSRDCWDCIPGAGADGYRFEAHYIGVLNPEQVVYAPPKPDPGGVVGPTPEPEPPPDHVCPPATYPSYEALGGDEGGKKITRQLDADFKRAGRPGLDADCGAWQQRVSYDFLTGICATVEESIAKHRKEWCDVLGIPVA